MNPQERYIRILSIVSGAVSAMLLSGEKEPRKLLTIFFVGFSCAVFIIPDLLEYFNANSVATASSAGFVGGLIGAKVAEAIYDSVTKGGIYGLYQAMRTYRQPPQPPIPPVSVPPPITVITAPEPVTEQAGAEKQP